jgi:hypothetical protein
MGDAIREVVWTLFTYGGCNKGGSSVLLEHGCLRTPRKEKKM